MKKTRLKSDSELKDKIVVPLDVNDIDEAKEIINELKDYVGIFKVNSIYIHYGRDIVEEIQKAGCKVFLDLKFHDIPNTVANYAREAVRLGAYIFNVHCSGGIEMIKSATDAAKDESEKLGFEKPIILGVTLLTSIDQNMLNNDLRVNGPAEDYVTHLAALAKKAGLDGVGASPKEIEAIRKACGKDFIILTPGVRPLWSEKGDQKRIDTPKNAIERGADYLVIGRPILEAQKYGMTRQEAARKIIEEIGQ
ncbi:MAG: orotidine-5'-phosphate decarboxylase [Candidatus Woesearchaeota archaeon]|nr:orotidine-5'-phosphate decarboxylase [Candidatus Woesearchaeota archaeon]